MNLKQSSGNIVVMTERKINLEDMKFHRGQIQAQLNQMDSDINEVETFMEGK